MGQLSETKRIQPPARSFGSFEFCHLLKEENKKYIGTSRGPGSIIFTYGEGGRKFITDQSHFPEERDIFVFPASLKHYVAPFQSPCERISVSGNVMESIPLAEMPKAIKYEVVQQ